MTHISTESGVNFGFPDPGKLVNSHREQNTQHNVDDLINPV